jgi:hypothetical protein
MPSRQRRSVANKSARWGPSKIAHEETQEEALWASEAGGRVFQSVKRQREYQGYRSGAPEVSGSASSMPILIGAAMIAASILLSTLITTLGSRYVGFEGPTEESAWLVDRLTGSLYKCRAPDRGKASCDSDIATGSVSERPKR